MPAEFERARGVGKISTIFPRISGGESLDVSEFGYDAPRHHSRAIIEANEASRRKAARVTLWNRLQEVFGSHGTKIVEDLYNVEKKRLETDVSKDKSPDQPKMPREDGIKMWHNAGMPPKGELKPIQVPFEDPQVTR